MTAVTYILMFYHFSLRIQHIKYGVEKCYGKYFSSKLPLIQISIMTA